jgi:alcohol dehydrogenase (cytochrome c)
MNPDTGEIVWARQIHPMSSWDQECTLEMPLVDITMSPDPDAAGMEAINPDFDFSSGPVSAIVGVPCKQGMVWAFERESGEFLWAKNVLEWQNLYSGVDEQGNVQVNEDVLLTEIGQSYRICPQFLGGRNYYPTAFSPLNNVLFVPTSNTCADAVPYTADPSPSEGYAVDSTVVPAPGKTNIGRLDAVSLETGETLWTYERRPARFSPVMASGGGLVFGGNLDGVFEAIDQETGEQLWSTRLPGQISGHTTTFMIDGVQYVAVTTGNSLVSNGFSSLTPEVDTRAGANAVFVFALPQD